MPLPEFEELKQKIEKFYSIYGEDNDLIEYLFLINPVFLKLEEQEGLPTIEVRYRYNYSFIKEWKEKSELCPNTKRKITGIVKDEEINVYYKELLQPLNEAIYNGNIDEVAKWLNAGGKADQVCPFLNVKHNKIFYYPIILCAAIYGKDEIVKLLQENEASLESELEFPPYRGVTPLGLAIITNSKNLFDKLISYGVNINQPMKIEHGKFERINPIYLAIKYNRVEMIKVLISIGVELNEPLANNSNLYPLDIATRNLETFKYLEKNGAIKCSNPVLYAVIANNLEMLNYLIQKGDYDLNLYTKIDSKAAYTPLEYAAKQGNIEIVKELLKHVNKDDIRSAFYYAIESKNINLVKMFLNKDIDVEKLSNQQFPKPGIYFAVNNGAVDIVELLLDNKVDVNQNIQLNDGSILSLLFIAINNNDINMVKCLIDRGANKNQFHDNGFLKNQSPLYYAIRNGYFEVAKYLISNKSGLNLPSPCFSSLFEAVVKCFHNKDNPEKQSKYLEIVAILILNNEPILPLVNYYVLNNENKEFCPIIYLLKSNLINQLNPEQREIVINNMITQLVDIIENDKMKEMLPKYKNEIIKNVFELLNSVNNINISINIVKLLNNKQLCFVDGPNNYLKYYVDIILKDFDNVELFKDVTMLTNQFNQVINDKPLLFYVLEEAFKRNELDKAEKILSVNLMYANSYSLIPIIAANGSARAMDVILQAIKVQDISNYAPGNKTLLSIAVNNCNLEVVKYLLERGVEFRAGQNYNPLIDAISGEFKTVIQENIPLENQRTEEQIKADFKEIALLLIMQPSTNIFKPKNNNHETPLYVAAKNGDIDIFNAIYNRNPDVINDHNHKLKCLLPIAVYNGNLEIAVKLLEEGINVNQKSTVGILKDKSPLDIAIKQGNVQIVKILLEYGAKIDVVIKDNLERRKYLQNKPEIKELLISYSIKNKDYEDEPNDMPHKKKQAVEKKSPDPILYQRNKINEDETEPPQKKRAVQSSPK